MFIFRRLTRNALFASVLCLAPACASDDPSGAKPTSVNPSSGGSPNSGGNTAATAGSGGARPGSSGGAATGGNTASGGNQPSGAGSSASGAAAGSAATTSGGNTSSGGTNAGGGEAGAAGASGSSGVATSGGSGSTGGSGGTTGGAAGTTGGSPGTGGGSSVYAPCPSPPELCRVMPLGDSITLGSGSKDPPGGGYRVPLYRLALKDNKQMTFVGDSDQGPSMVDGVPFPTQHDGHSGYIIERYETRKGLTTLIDGIMAKHNPHIVLLMIGTNDINANLELDKAPAKLAALLDQIAAGAPNAHVVVAQVTPTHTQNDKVEAFNSTIPAMVSERAQAGGHFSMVDMYHAFTAKDGYKNDLMKDGLHPNNAGYVVMADVWYKEISKFLH